MGTTGSLLGGEEELDLGVVLKVEVEVEAKPPTKYDDELLDSVELDRLLIRLVGLGEEDWIGRGLVGRSVANELPVCGVFINRLFAIADRL